jgi:heat-inducible transcriptional repressor
MDSAVIDNRSREILKQIVHLFITTGEPVGSRTLSRLSSEGLSPATIRNIMSDLEEAGFLYQPHTSAGRVPTDRGYRFYVGTLVDGKDLPPADAHFIREQIRPTDGGLPDLVRRTSRLLSKMTGMVGFVTGPDVSQSILRHVDFVRLAPRRILVMLVSSAGQVFHRFAEIPEDLSGEELAQCARYLEEQFTGFTLLEAREILLLRTKEIELVVNRLVKNALTIADAAFSERPAAELHLEGTSRMLGEPEFVRNVERAQQLFATLEERHRLVTILNACLDGAGLSIVIGSEAQVPDLEGISLIGARYGDGEKELGAIGIMGPTRMEYAKHISVVDCVACSLSAAITEVGGSGPKH